MTAGDLLGPFDGVVVDAETDRPISGATVVASWGFERGIGLTGPSGASEFVTETGVDGRYRVPALRELPAGGGSLRVRRFTLIVYHRGHVSWRSDRRFPDGERRRDFAQRANRVRLDAWRNELSHHRHLVFVGGGAAVRKVAAWEAELASAELGGDTVRARREGPAGGAGAPTPLDASPLLSAEEVSGVTGFGGAFEVGELADLPTTEFYDSVHFKAKDRPETYDVALRVWRLGSDAAEVQYEKLLGELPGAQPRDEIGDVSLRARTPDVLGLAFLLRERGLVVSLSCGTAQCTDPEMLLRLAKLVDSHLGRLPAAPLLPAAPPAPVEPEAAPAGPPASTGTPAGPSRTPPSGGAPASGDGATPAGPAPPSGAAPATVNPKTEGATP